MILEEIAEKTKDRVEQAKKHISLAEMKRRAEALPVEGTFPFEEELRRPGISFICEVKKASPSKGVIAPDFDYLSIAKQYVEAGANAMSVLTEPDYLMGSIE